MAIPILFYAGGKMPAYIEDLRVVIPKIPKIREYNEDDNGHLTREDAAILAAALRVPIPEFSKNVNTEYGTGIVIPRPATDMYELLIDGLLATSEWNHAVMTDREVLYPSSREDFPHLAALGGGEDSDNWLPTLQITAYVFNDLIKDGMNDDFEMFLHVWRCVQKAYAREGEPLDDAYVHSLQKGRVSHAISMYDAMDFAGFCFSHDEEWVKRLNPNALRHLLEKAGWIIMGTDDEGGFSDLDWIMIKPKQ
jgi:hypothetical protein